MRTGKQNSLDIYWRVQLVCLNVHADTSSEPLVEYLQDQTYLMNQGYLWLIQPTWELRKYYAFYFC